MIEGVDTEVGHHAEDMPSDVGLQLSIAVGSGDEQSDVGTEPQTPLLLANRIVPLRPSICGGYWLYKAAGPTTTGEDSGMTIKGERCRCKEAFSNTSRSSAPGCLSPSARASRTRMDDRNSCYSKASRACDGIPRSWRSTLLAVWGITVRLGGPSGA